MSDETADWTAPEVTPLTEAGGAATARVRNGEVVPVVSGAA